MRRYVIVVCLMLAGGASAPAAPDTTFLEYLLATEGGVTLVHGDAPASEAAAQIVRDRIRSIPGHDDWDNVMSDAAFDALDYHETGLTHVIVVGTLRDSEIMRGRNWLPTWFLDRDWYFNEYEHGVPADQLMDYTPRSGFVVGGFGQWPKGEDGVGYVEVDRSFLFMEWLVRTRQDIARTHDPKEMGRLRRKVLQNTTEPQYPKDEPMRLLVRITGTGPAGLEAAAEAFAERNLLSGVVLAGTEADDGPTMWTLPPSRYATVLPVNPPDDIEGYRYVGWLLPDAFQYDGFTAEAGVTPVQMYRVKYMPDFGIVNFWTSPHRRASQFEVAVATFDTADEAATAREQLMRSIEQTGTWKSGAIRGLHCRVVGRVLLIESIPELPHDAGRKILDAFAEEIRGAKID